MAITHISFNPATTGGGRKRQLISSLEGGYSMLLSELRTFQTLVDGDGSQAAHFTAAQGYYGYSDTTEAKKGWDELQSLKYILSSTATLDGNSVNPSTAILQAADKFR